MGTRMRAYALTEKAYLWLWLFVDQLTVSSPKPATPRGRCPECLRDLALLSDGRIAYAHRRRPRGRSWCAGYGKPALPLEVKP